MSLTVFINEKPYSARPGETIMDLLRREGFALSGPCGGKGTCGKCKVSLNGAQALACRTEVREGCRVTAVPEGALALEERGRCALWPVDITPGVPEGALGVACDIGTTTVVCHLLDLRSGKRLGTIGGANAQRAYGADVISRIQASIDGHLKNMQSVIVGQINDYVNQLCAAAEADKNRIRYMAVCGNTVMCHIFASLPPDGIGFAPFTPLSLFGNTYDTVPLGLDFPGEVYITPSVSGYVGGDITADILACTLAEEKAPVLLMDVGTNGEIVLGCGEKLLCCATAAGPAFEGAEITFGMASQAGAISRVWLEKGRVKTETIGGAAPVGICGSGLLDALALMLDLGAVDETGRLLEPDESPAAHLLVDLGDDDWAFGLTDLGDIYITQLDIRRLQLAKAALAAGIAVLAEQYGAEDITALILAGGFGSRLDPKSAARIGLIPPALLPVTRAVGNAAGEGAVSALLSRAARDKLQAIAKSCRYIELSGRQDFSEKFIEAMMFE